MPPGLHRGHERVVYHDTSDAMRVQPPSPPPEAESSLATPEQQIQQQPQQVATVTSDATENNNQHHPQKKKAPVSGASPLESAATLELEHLRNSSPSTSEASTPKAVHFPGACMSMLRSKPGNSQCIDCGQPNPQWAAMSYGALICLQCSGNHRGLGVNVSTVRSITMDHWTYSEILRMLEGGNAQLSQFFQRHHLDEATCRCNESGGIMLQSKALTPQNVTLMRYKTKAALFYRQQLERHVVQLSRQGPYQVGRQSKRNGSGGSRKPPGRTKSQPEVLSKTSTAGSSTVSELSQKNDKPPASLPPMNNHNRLHQGQ